MNYQNGVVAISFTRMDDATAAKIKLPDSFDGMQGFEAASILLTCASAIVTGLVRAADCESKSERMDALGRIVAELTASSIEALEQEGRL